MKIKQILMAVVFTAVLVGCGGKDPKADGEKAGKEVCEKMKSGEFDTLAAQKFMTDAQKSFGDDPADAQIWLEAYMAASKDCMK